MTLARFGIEVSWPFAFVVFGVGIVAAGLIACPLHDPVPIDPGYPPDPPFKTLDAGPG